MIVKVEAEVDLGDIDDRDLLAELKERGIIQVLTRLQIKN